ncbi:NAD(P)H-dependent oxidoreductase [Brevundimonas sp. 2R-24]|uniref:NAD(P)H-dependent oxidoreductase n=1 Tax=Peiella sedimenti TaxID=3061083 RepID=A0ABT8SJ39_9CAUL|nr:NAD(P)H-dependent oxidoreductase [Caulobacteraceae bacterium XZ-24]
MARILIINGHPDPSAERLVAALAGAYASGAREAGHEVREITLGELDFPVLRSAEAFNDQPPPPVIAAVQRDIKWAQHMVVVFPLWLGGLPAMTKGFFEQAFRPQFTMRWRKNQFPQGLLGGLTCRLVVTMGMPALAFQMLFGAHGVKSFQRSVLGLAGIKTTGRTLIGGAGEGFEAEPWLRRLHALGRAGR